MQRTIFSIIIGVSILSLSLFLLNSWLNKQNEGLFLTQDTYVGTITWYEDATTPPAPTDLAPTTPLISTATPQKNPTPEATPSNVLDIITANGTTSIPLEPEVYDVNTGKFIKVEQKREPITPAPQPTAPPTTQKTTPPQTVPAKQKTPPPTKPTPQPSTPTPQVTPTINRIFLTKDPKRPLRIEANTPLTYKSFYLSSPDRIVIDLTGAFDTSKIAKTISQNPSIKDARVSSKTDSTRIVIDLVKQPKIWSVVHGARKNTIDISLSY